MTEVKITRITELEDPKLRQFADEVAQGLMAAAWKAAAHHAAPKQVSLPAGDTLERRFVDYLKARPEAVQQKVAARGLSLVQSRQVPGLEGLDLMPARPTMDIVRSRVKLDKLVARRGGPVKAVAPVLEDGVLGFRKQSGPTELQFLLTKVKCIDETDGFLGSHLGSDEIAIGGVMVDAAGTTVAIPKLDLGDFKSSGVTKNYNPPKSLGKLNFLGGSGWPKSFSLVLTLVELDNGNFPALLSKLLDEARTAVAEAVGPAARATFGDKLGEAIASAIDWVLDKVFGALRSWWEDDLFAPATFNFEFPAADARFGGSDELEMWVDWKGHGGRYMTWLQAQLGPVVPAGTGELFKSLGNGDIRTVRMHNRWRRTWDQIVSGGFGLLFYDAHTGVGEFYAVNADGTTRLLKQHSGWRKTWKQIIPGNFTNQGVTDLLFYDAHTGVGEFYAVNADGTTRLLKQHTGWRKTWTQIIAGNFGGNGFTDLLFYDASTGEAAFYATDGAGNMQMLRSHSGWRKTWAKLVPGSFGGTSATDILLYDASKGESEFYAVSNGQMSLLRKHTGWRKTWAQIVPGNFGGDGFTDLLLYDRQAGEAEVHKSDGKGQIHLLRSHKQWRKSWAQMVPASFTGNNWSDLVFYDPTS